MAKALVVVESPAKAKTINKYLGRDFKVIASMGHIRDLPKSRLGVDVDNDFEPLYIIPKERKDRVKKLKEMLAEVDELRNALALRVLARAGEHGGGLVDADQADPCLRDGHGDPAGADGQLDHRPARGDGLGDVELDVLGDGHRPGVVDTCDPVVQGVGAQAGLRAT